MIKVFLPLFLVLNLFQTLYSQKFIHPGIDMTSADLVYMKQQVTAGVQPWKDAFIRLKEGARLESEIIPFAHVQRGSYGKPNIGGGELSRNASLAYDCALIWYITGKKEYAEKAKDILNSWSAALQHFDYNDAKLLAGWTGYLLCNAAEILLYSDSEWKPEEADSFRRMIMTVYYPLIRYYYPQANGNWDGAIIHSILAIAVFMDNREMFDNAIDHFLHGPVNGSLFKYIYPSGQCQESTRDQGHVQLGLGEFAGAARVAYTQGVDLFAAGNHRIAAGFEYTAGFLLGYKPHCYGIISERAKNIRDDYEYVYRHYESKGIDLPYTKMCADSARKRATRSILTGFRAPSSGAGGVIRQLEINRTGYPAGAREKSSVNAAMDNIKVYPGESIQKALDDAAGTNKTIIIARGIHTLPSTLKIPSGITLAGEGIETILFLDPSSGMREAVVKADANLHDITIRDLVIEGNTRTETGTDPNSTRSYRSTSSRGGIMLLADHGKRLKNISLVNITVRNCTYNAVFINGADSVTIIGCDFNESGSSVVPGPKLQHNLLLSHCSNVVIRDSRLVNSPHGSGIALDKCTGVEITNCEISRNAYYGLVIMECKDVCTERNLIEANDRSGIMVEFLFSGSENLRISDNLIQYNNGYGVESYAAIGMIANGNRYEGNGNRKQQQQISGEKKIIMN